MQLHFTKMHGAGNDFVVIDLISQDYTLRPQEVRRLADRHLGVGCDQVLTVEAPHNPQVDSATVSTMPTATRCSSAAMVLVVSPSSSAKRT